MSKTVFINKNQIAVEKSDDYVYKSNEGVVSLIDDAVSSENDTIVLDIYTKVKTIEVSKGYIIKEIKTKKEKK